MPNGYTVACYSFPNDYLEAIRAVFGTQPE
jgi:hypothetical protein